MDNMIGASEFKAKCLSLLDQVAETGRPLTITKRGKIVAQLVPAPEENTVYPQHTLFGTVLTADQLLEPALQDQDSALEEGLL